MYTLARSNVCSAWERAGKHHTNPSGAVRHTAARIYSFRQEMQEVIQDLFLSLQFIYSRSVLCKAASLVPDHAAVLTEVQGSVAQREKEASREEVSFALGKQRAS